MVFQIMEDVIFGKWLIFKFQDIIYLWDFVKINYIVIVKCPVCHRLSYVKTILDNKILLSCNCDISKFHKIDMLIQ